MFGVFFGLIKTPGLWSAPQKLDRKSNILGALHLAGGYLLISFSFRVEFYKKLSGVRNYFFWKNIKKVSCCKKPIATRVFAGYN